MATVLQINSQINRVVNNVPAIGSSSPTQKLVNSTSDRLFINSQLIGTSHEVIVVGDITDDVMATMKNTHATAVIEVGVVVTATFYPLIKIPAGETAILPRINSLSGTFLRSSVANADLEVVLYKIA